MEGDRHTTPFLVPNSGFLSTPSAWRATYLDAMGITDDKISIHALRMEGDSNCTPRQQRFLSFLSTPSAWRATYCSGTSPPLVAISIHALRMEGDTLLLVVVAKLDISIHALRMEGDLFGLCGLLRGLWISIHALRMEGDRRPGNRWTVRPYFYPRPPHGGRPIHSIFRKFLC